MSYAVITKTINPYGICLEEGEDGARYWHASGTHDFDTSRFIFRASNIDYAQHLFSIEVEDLVSDYIRRIYNLSDDITIITWFSTPRTWRRDTIYSAIQRTFETEAEVSEYVDGLGNPIPIATFSNNASLFGASWSEEIDGFTIRRSAVLNYTGDDTVTLYTINDLVNFLALFFGITTEEVPLEYTYDPDNRIDSSDPDSPPSIDCEPHWRATIIDINGPAGPVEIDIDFTGGSIPGDVTVTTIDGDPPLTSLENGNGSVTVSDNGNINMSNDGGTFYLNEFGNAGFYANGPKPVSYTHLTLPTILLV